MRKVIEIGPAEELDETPEQVGKRKAVRVNLVGEQAAIQPRED